MIIIKHTKSDNLAFVSHVDFMRVLQRALLRAGIKVKMSEGFNPHPITFCSHPLPVGVESDIEYFCYAENDSKSVDEIKEIFEKSTPDGVRVIEVLNSDVNPKIVTRATACEYNTKVNLSNEDVACLETFFKKSPNIMTLVRKGDSVEVDISTMILSYKVTSEILTLRLMTGNPTLRPDRLIDFINSQCSMTTKINITDTKRVGYYTEEEGETINVDDYLKRLVK